MDRTVSEIYKDLSISFLDFVTRNEATIETLKIAERAARSDVTMLILGENGTGKNLLAQAIHNASSRKSKPFVSVNCGALTETLVESELFGHEQGAYTGAHRDRKGRFELADGGTLFLDEIAELSPAVQAKILTAVEYRQFERVGGERTIRTDVRMIAATNRDVRDLVEEGGFREDLYYRLNEVTLELPALRERPEDIPPLAERFLLEAAAKFGKTVTGIADDAMRLLVSHDWPGNIRELKGVLRRGAAICTGEVIQAADLGPLLSHQADADAGAPAPGACGTPAPGVPGTVDLSLASAEARHIRKVLALTGGNKKRAAEVMGIARSTLDRKVQEYGIDPARERRAGRQEQE